MVTPRPLAQPRRLKVFLVAGEASGDAYGALLLKELQRTCQDRGWALEAVGWGGDAMQSAGMRLLTHCNTINFMGFWEVAQHLPTILRNLKRAQRDVVAESPDVVVTLDFPGFNMRLARALRSHGHHALRVQWVAPQVWAWKAGRIQKLAEDFDAVAPILPFEAKALSDGGVEVWNEGHPLLDLVAVPGEEERSLPLVLLPGSRQQELKHHLPVFIQAAHEGASRGLWTLADVVVAGAPGRSLQDYKAATDAGLTVTFGETQRLLAQAQLAWVASGTATLEAALLDTPHVLVYRTSPLTYAVAKRLAKVAYIGLPNLLLNEGAVPELIQHDFTVEALLEHTQGDLQAQRAAFQRVRQTLGGSGAAARLAQRLTEAFQEA